MNIKENLFLYLGHIFLLSVGIIGFLLIKKEFGELGEFLFLLIYSLLYLKVLSEDFFKNDK